jgi:hypothetical protein
VKKVTDISALRPEPPLTDAEIVIALHEMVERIDRLCERVVKDNESRQVAR